MKYLIVIAVFSCNFLSSAQISAGILEPDSHAQFQIDSSNKRILIPKVKLSTTTNADPIATNVLDIPKSLLVFNTQKVNDVDIGYYYWNDKWNKLIKQIDIENLNNNSGRRWNTVGNSILSSHFIGTTNGFPLSIKTNDTERINIDQTGKIIIDAPSVPIGLGSHIILNNIPETGSIYYVGVNSAGELYRQGPNSKTFDYVTVKFINVKGNYISDFNMGIDSNKYTIVIVGYSFDVIPTVMVGSRESLPSFTVNNFISGGTWRLKLGYISTSSSNATISVNLLICDNKEVNVIGTKIYNLNGSSVGNTGSNPIIQP